MYQPQLFCKILRTDLFKLVLFMIQANSLHMYMVYSIVFSALHALEQLMMISVSYYYYYSMSAGMAHVITYKKETVFCEVPEHHMGNEHV